MQAGLKTLGVLSWPTRMLLKDQIMRESQSEGDARSESKVDHQPESGNSAQADIRKQGTEARSRLQLHDTTHSRLATANTCQHAVKAGSQRDD